MLGRILFLGCTASISRGIRRCLLFGSAGNGRCLLFGSAASGRCLLFGSTGSISRGRCLLFGSAASIGRVRFEGGGGGDHRYAFLPLFLLLGFPHVTKDLLDTLEITSWVLQHKYKYHSFFLPERA